MIIDLTHPIQSGMPVYPGDPAVVAEPAGTLEADGFADSKLSFGTHVGTHMDPPAHMVEGGRKLSTYEVDDFILPAIVVDVRAGFDKVDPESITLEAGHAVLFYTGASDYFLEEKYWHEYSVLTKQWCDVLVERGIKLVGVDTGSVDIEDGFPVHKHLLGANLLLLENLTNLKDLVGEELELIALPLKLELDGAPARVVARTND